MGEQHVLCFGICDPGSSHISKNGQATTMRSLEVSPREIKVNYKKSFMPLMKCIFSE